MKSLKKCKLASRDVLKSIELKGIPLTVYDQVFNWWTGEVKKFQLLYFDTFLPWLRHRLRHL